MVLSRETPLEKKEEVLSAALDFPVSDYTGQEVVYQLAGETSETAINLYKNAFETNNIYVRQAIASSIERIPKQLKNEFSLAFKQSDLVLLCPVYSAGEKIKYNFESKCLL